MNNSATASRRLFLSWLAASPMAASAAPALAQQRIASEVRTADDALNVFELEAVARRNVPAAHFGYLSGGVLDDRTVQANRAAFDAWGLRARRLVDVSRVDISTTLFGQAIASPVILAPVSSGRAFHPDGEAAVARAAGKRRALQVLSALTTVSLEDVKAAHAGAGGGEVWQQIYTTNRPETGLAVVRRADAAGAGAIVLTVDLAGGMRRETQALGARVDARECSSCHRQSGGYDFSRKRMFDGLDMAGVVSPTTPTLTWDYIARMREVTRKRILVKGVMTGADAEIAVRRGVDGIIVSNHGGRAEESLIGTLDVLPEVAAAVRGRIPVIIDGGFRRGTDVFKALALGASAVAVGRPYMWGLGAFGEEGVAAALRLIDEELVATMRQAGVTRLSQITQASLSPRPR
jgi:isopentenyl diphosphate isomerase/L-lactate dehydrogenase-like FMN-dependent dehydrogenase